MTTENVLVLAILAGAVILFVSERLRVDLYEEIKAGMSITLKVGANTVKLDNTGVTIDGTLVTIKGKAMTEVSASGILTLRGALTKIN